MCAWCGVDLAEHGEPLQGRMSCKRCGAMTTNAPAAGDLDDAYGDWYRPATGRFSGPGDRLLRHARAHLATRLDRIAPPGEILDIGAGDGSLLDAIEARGRAAVGLERESVRDDVLTGSVEELDGPFAAIVLWHSLEHLPDAGRALERAVGLLAPGGVIVIAMPNPASLQALAFGDRWLALDMPRHLVHVPQRALLDRLRELGLHVERVSQLRGGQAVFGWLHGLVGMLPGGLDLYDAIRRPEARMRPMSAFRRAAATAAAIVLLPAAAGCALAEAALLRGGSSYVEARRV